MRFLIGIITGAILTLLIATILDAPAQPTLDLAADRLEDAWDNLIDDTSERLFGRHPVPDPGRQPVTGPVDREDHSPATDSTPGRIPPGSEQNLDVPPAARLEPGAAVPTDEPPAVALEAAKLPPEVAAVAPLPAPVQAPAPTTVLPSVPALDAVLDLDGDPGSIVPRALPEPAGPTPLAQTGIAPVWVPFHSQMSAEGFAARLSRELNHPFSVERRSAGTYQVVFSARTPAEQDAVLARIAELTGS
jgi:hypothetical protein